MYPNQIYSVWLIKKRRTPEMMETNTTDISPHLDQSTLVKPKADTKSAPSSALPDET